MVEHIRENINSDEKFRLLSVATLLKKIRDGITIEELYRDAERKYDTLIALINDEHGSSDIVNTFGYTIEELKQASLFIFNRLISEGNSNPYMTLCVPQGASLDEIKRRRNKLLQIFHPDRKWTELNDEAKTRKINEAYEAIVNNQYPGDDVSRKGKFNIPRSYTYHGIQFNMKAILFLVIVVFLITFFSFMKTINFF